jgi:deazaflavin-dependent oxidoreductase (nitroreductase family)
MASLRRSRIKVQSRLHRWAYVATGGLIGGRIGRSRILLLTTRGRRSGQPRVTPLIYLPHDQNLVVIASNAGDYAAPQWWRNLQHEPRAHVQVGREQFDVTARLATNAERPKLWRLAVASYPTYETYQRRTDRQISVVVLEPVH